MPHKFNHARRHKFEKARYRLRNWPSYDAALRRRGDVRLWISEEAIAGWLVERGRGVYSDPAVETCLTLRVVFGLALRQTEDFVASILKLLDLDLPVPDHTTLSRRAQGLALVGRKVPGTGALDRSSLQPNSAGYTGLDPYTSVTCGSKNLRGLPESAKSG